MKAVSISSTIELQKQKKQFTIKTILEKYKYFIIGFMPVVLVLVVLSLGRYPISPYEFATIIYAKIFGLELYSETMHTVLFEIRLPRILAAMLVGGALSVSGVAFQGIFKNPLVSPDILGVSAGAGLGAAIAIMLSLGNIGIHIMAFAFGLMAVLFTYFISNAIKKVENVLIMVLSGILVGTVFNALISLIKCMADPFNKLPSITFWLMGGLSAISFTQVAIIILPVLLGIIPLLLLRWRLNVISFGDEEAQTLGLNTSRLRITIIICATLLTSAAVSISGIIGWVGLVIPHLARAIVGPNYNVLIPVSILMGGMYLLLVDTIARVLLPMEIPLGILTALIGAPFFIYLLTRTQKGWK